MARIVEREAGETSEAASVIVQAWRIHRVNQKNDQATKKKALLEREEDVLAYRQQALKSYESVQPGLIMSVWHWWNQTEEHLTTMDSAEAELAEAFYTTSPENARDMLKEQVQDVQKLRREIQELERSVSDISRKLHDPAHKVVKVHEPLIEEIERLVHPDLAAVLRMPFDKCKNEEYLKEWRLDEATGVYHLEFHQPIKMWVPSLDDRGKRETLGGAVILLGNNEERILQMRLNPETQEMQFDQGFHIYFHLNLALRSRHEQPITSLRMLDNGMIKFSISMLGTQARDKSVASFHLNWKTHGELLGEQEDHADYLTAKM
jgi:hypothetical protein